MVAASMHVIYLHTLAGNPGLSPALQELAATGIEVLAPTLPGFDGSSGWTPPHDHLGWLTQVWDRIDATGALPCPVIGASIGGMFAAELAIFRPEAVTALALLAPLGIWADIDAADPFAMPGSQRLPFLFAAGVPNAFEEQYNALGADGNVARYLAQMAGASLVWPIPDRDLDTRIHRISQRTLLLWGAQDKVAPAETAKRWAGVAAPNVVQDAGHLLEWDQPQQVSAALLDFLNA